jgi:hypothetical protein
VYHSNVAGYSRKQMLAPPTKGTGHASAMCWWWRCNTTVGANIETQQLSQLLAYCKLIENLNKFHQIIFITGLHLGLRLLY